MDLLHTQGVVLSSHRTGEADVICSILTADSGKRRFIFKGLKKSKTRGPSSSEPGSIVRLVYYYHEEKTAYYVSDVSLERSNDRLIDNLEAIYHLYYILELVDRTSPFDVPDRQLYDLLSTGIAALAETVSYAHFAVFFTLHLLKLQGLLPDLGTCRSCGAVINDSFVLDITDFRPVCRSCSNNAPHGRNHGGAGKSLPPGVMHYLSGCLSTKFSRSSREGIEDSDLLDLLFRIILYIQNYYHIDLNTTRFILSGNRGKN